MIRGLRKQPAALSEPTLANRPGSFDPQEGDTPCVPVVLPGLVLSWFGLLGLVYSFWPQLGHDQFNGLPVIAALLVYGATGPALISLCCFRRAGKVAAVIAVALAGVLTVQVSWAGLLPTLGACAVAAAVFNANRGVVRGLSLGLAALAFMTAVWPDVWHQMAQGHLGHHTMIDSILGVLTAYSLYAYAGMQQRPRFTRGLALAIVGIGGTLVAVLTWFLLTEQARRTHYDQARLLSVQTISTLHRGINEQLDAASRLARRLSISSDATLDSTAENAFYQFLQDYDTTSAIMLVDSDIHVIQEVERVPGLAQWMRGQLEQPAMRAFLQHIQQSGTAHLGPVEVTSDIRRALLITPLSGGSVTGLFTVQAQNMALLFDRSLSQNLSAVRFRLGESSETLYDNIDDQLLSYPVAEFSFHPQHDVTWTLQAWLSPHDVPFFMRVLPDILLLVCLMFTWLLARTMRLSIIATRRSSQLAHAVTHDYLTGLPNKTWLVKALADQCHKARNEGKRLSVVLFDLNGLKLINDTMGMAVGDHILREVAQRISSHLPKEAKVARLEGDEFIVMLPDTSATKAARRTQALIAAISRPYQYDQISMHITASAGMTSSDGAVSDPMSLVKEADLAMLQAKQAGRNTWREYAPEMGARTDNRLALRTDLQRAVTHGQFTLHYQPLVNGYSGRIVGTEALLRWPHTDKGYISPAIFVPLAEEAGLIVPLSKWVLDRACRDLKWLKTQWTVDFPFIINVSPLYFQHPEFMSDLTDALRRYGLTPEDLQIEITEGLLLDSVTENLHKLNALRSLGIGISVDDFGTGYSSLRYLKDLPIDKIKIDSSFVRDVVSDRNDAAIAKAIIGLAHHLSLRVVAEGVETDAQYWFLKRNFCDEYQGHLFAAAMPLDRLKDRLQAHGGVEALPTPIASAGSERSLLIVDDEENILNALQRFLRRDGYTIYRATTTEQAFDLLAEHDIRVILSDQRLPGGTGTAFFSRVKQIYPDTIRIILSGYADLKSVTDAINHGAIYKFLTKPWDEEELRQVLIQAFKDAERLAA